MPSREDPRRASARRGALALSLLALAGCVAPAPRVEEPAAACVEEPPACPGDEPQPAIPDPPVRRTVIGLSAEGRDIDLIEVGAGPEAVLVFGAFHGDEAESASVAEWLGEALIDCACVPPSRTVTIIPQVNPDGVAAGTRVNARGVDLNRNLPATNWRPAPGGAGGVRGDMPGSEPETRLAMALISSCRPVLIISIHTIGRGGWCVNFDGPAEAIARRMADRCGYPLRPSMGYETFGSLGSYAGIDLGIATITLELPRGQDVDISWDEVREALIDAVAGPWPELSL
ncbi:MAG: DUF2817 domain-containing protein [Planctomycetes bacterium]|nr:DUF2817 domain-containing protein [Planctomycetota bacterium]